MTIKTITPKDLYRRMKLGHNVVLLDVRTQNEFEEGHISGAMSYPLESFNAEAVIHKISPPFPTPPTIYVTCASDSQSTKACKRLADAGYEYIIMVEGGIRAWRGAGLPIKRIKENVLLFQPLQIRQQIQVVVGSLVILGTLLGTFVNPGFLAISLLAGTGLAYEGLFGTDYLKQALLKMSWNRQING